MLYVGEDRDVAAACAPVAGLPLCFRALMTAVRAGCRPVGVPAGFRQTAVERAILASPAARRAAVWLDRGPLPGRHDQVLLMPVTAVLPTRSLAALLAVSPPAVLLGAPAATPIAVVPAAQAADVAGPAMRGDPAGRALGRALAALAPPGVAGSWCVAAAGGPDRREAERRLYRELGSAIDTRFDTAVHRPASRRLTAVALRLGLAANAISLAGLAVGLAAAISLAWPTAATALLGVLLYFASVVLDHSDGEVARLRLAESRLGEWLDVSIDTLVHAACALALGIAAERAAGWGLWAGAAAAAGFTASALAAKTAPASSGASARDRALAALGTRDGFYVLLGLHVVAVSAAPPALPYLVTVAAIGSHAFWTASLALRWHARRPGRRPSPAAAGTAGTGPVERG